MRDNENKDFHYTYSAKEQEELKKIREKYTPTTEVESKLDRVRRLDKSVVTSAQAASVTVGTVGALILGSGMSLYMTELSEILSIGNELALILCIILGLIGGVLIAFAYPIYNAMVQYKRKKLAPEILRLTDELMK